MEAALACVPCDHSKERQNILSDGGKRVSKQTMHNIWYDEYYIRMQIWTRSKPESNSIWKYSLWFLLLKCKIKNKNRSVFKRIWGFCEVFQSWKWSLTLRFYENSNKQSSEQKKKNTENIYTFIAPIQSCVRFNRHEMNLGGGNPLTYIILHYNLTNHVIYSHM